MLVTDVSAGCISEKKNKKPTVNETCSSGVRQVVNIVKLLLEVDICHKTQTHTKQPKFCFLVLHVRNLEVFIMS